MITAALAAVYIARHSLQELYLSNHYFVHAALGWRRRPPGAFSIIAMIDGILRIGIVKRNAIMMIDFALDALGQLLAMQSSKLVRRDSPS